MREKRKCTLYVGNGRPIEAKSYGRNELCPCGSGKKVKNCHKLETRYFQKPVKKEAAA